MTDVEVGARLGVAVTTLQQWRHRKTGPPFVKVGRMVRYHKGDVEAWFAASRVLTTEGCATHAKDARELGRLGAAAAREKVTREQRAEWGRKGAQARWAAQRA